MTPEEQKLILSLAVVPGRSPLPKECFLESFGVQDGRVLGLNLLQSSVERRDPVDVELALIVSFTFGFTMAHLDPLHLLAFSDWHEQHENVATALGLLRSPTSVQALLHLAAWVPNYLQFDEARALATKAVWALGGIGTDCASESLRRLAGGDDALVAEAAKAQL